MPDQIRTRVRSANLEGGEALRLLLGDPGQELQVIADRIWGDGSSLRDYCYIDDLLEAIALALGAPRQADFSVYNVASGQVAPSGSSSPFSAAWWRASRTSP